jgi:phosphoenolpyruvate---glycerone phosphotransferase subunit DhaK
MEVGIGHHGEPGVRVESLKSAAEVARDMAKAVLDDHNPPAGSEVAMLVSGLGATPTNELECRPTSVCRWERPAR